MDELTALDILTNIDLLRNPRATIESRRQAAQYLADNPNNVALPVMIRALEDPDFFIRKSAILACERFASPLTVDPLIRVLRERTFSEREEAIRILGKLKDRRAIEPVAEALLYSDWMSIRSEAAYALGEMHALTALPALVEGLQDFEAPVRANVAEALGKLAHPDSVVPLIEALKREKGWNRRHMANALVNIGEPSMKSLVTILADTKENGEIREVVAESLTILILNTVKPQKIQALIKMTVDLLVAELPTRNTGIRNHVARSALTRISGIVADQLIEAFANSNPTIRDQVAYILGDSKAPDINDKLIRALALANEQVASGAARVLYFRDQDPRKYGYMGVL
jgi:HEAT repeat protein